MGSAKQNIIVYGVKQFAENYLGILISIGVWGETNHHQLFLGRGKWSVLEC